ncbi:hypothetical protein [Corallibacter sp.]|uniref:hypothetical protein n=1 Tax=Corallibacter sp. TaxID=2038084 RepID=UPI003A94C0E8
MSNSHEKVSKSEFKRLSPSALDDLNMLSSFYYEVINPASTGIIRKPAPKEFLNFLKNHYKNKLNDQSL